MKDTCTNDRYTNMEKFSRLCDLHGQVYTGMNCWTAY